MAILEVESFGQKGVNVDLDPLELGDDQFTQTQNAVSDPAAGKSAIRKRPGLVAFTTSGTGANVLGGLGVPLQHLLSGTHFIYVGRGTE